MIDLLSEKQRISMLAIDIGFDFQVRQGYATGWQFVSCRLPKLKKTGHFAVLCKFYNFECQRDSRQTFFTSFERGSDDSYPFLMIMTDSKVLFSYV